MHNQGEEGAKRRETTGGDGKALFNSRPDSDVGCIPLSRLAKTQRGGDTEQLTEEVGGVELGKEWQTCNDRSASNATHGKKWNESDFCSPLQLQVPNQESWQECEREISDDAEDTVDETKSNDDGVIDARPIFEGLFPEKPDGVALKESDEEESRAGECRDKHGSVDDPCMDTLNGDA